MLLNEKIVYVGPFIPRKERTTGSDPDNFTNCYIKHLDASYNEEDLRRDFELFGIIQSAVLLKDPKGNVAFVNYERPEDAKKSIDALNGKRLCGDKDLYVGRAQKKGERESFLKKLREERAQKYQGINLYVKNLDDSVNDVKLLEAFSPFGNITSCKVMIDEKTNSRGFGFVCFTNADDASKAVTDMNGSMLSGKPVYVALAERKEVRRAKLEAQYAARQASRLAGNPTLTGPMYPGAPVFYPPQAPQNQRQGAFVYPPQGMPVARRGWPAPVQPGQRGQPFQTMPNYMVQPMGQRQPHRQPRGGQMQQGNGRNFKYTQNARNQAVAGQGPAAPGIQMAVGPLVGLGDQPLSAPSLASASPEQRKEMLGERLFPLIEAVEPHQGPKITGMLLESMEVPELLHLLQSPDALREKIEEALDVLKAHNQGDIDVLGNGEAEA